jgi:beta-alanine--pyruvate transaminase
MTILSDQLHLHRDQLDAYWMPFTSNRHFKAAPRMLASADGMYYKTDDGKTMLDGFAGLWCCHATSGDAGFLLTLPVRPSAGI